MMRAVVVLSAVLLISCGPTWEQRPVIVSATGERLCVAHNIPLITVRGFQASPSYVSPPDNSSESWRPSQFPNRIRDHQSLSRTTLCKIPAQITYCPKCQQEYELASVILI